MRYWILILIILVGWNIETVIAQWTKSISINSSYDDNAFRNYTGRNDYVSQFSAYLAHDFGRENWQARLFYRGSLNIFARNDDRNYLYQQFGTAWSRKLNQKGDILNFGANGRLRSNRTLYDYYNFKEGAGYGNFRFNFGEASIANFGYKFQARWYSNLDEFSYLQHYFFVRYTHFFKTRTSLMLEGNYGQKIYREVLPDDSGSTGIDGHDGGHRGGMGHFGSGGRDMNRDSLNTNPGTSQWVGQLRLTQSLTNSTGISFEFRLRRNPEDGVRYLAGQVSGYTTEDELFDDRFGYESEEMSATLTQLFPWKMKFQLGSEVQWKNYLNRPAQDLNGEVLPSGELRNDRQILGWASLSKFFLLMSGQEINFIAEVFWLNNDSNDLYYDYQVSIISLSVSMSF